MTQQNCTLNKIKAIINNYKDAEQISSKMGNSLLPDKIKTPNFDLQPKIEEDLRLVLSTATHAEYMNLLIITYSQQWQTLNQEWKTRQPSLKLIT